MTINIQLYTKQLTKRVKKVYACSMYNKKFYPSHDSWGATRRISIQLNLK